MPAWEMPRPVPVDRIGAGSVETVEATLAECSAIAGRLMVPSLESLHCRWVLRPSRDGSVEAEGSLYARLHQDCVVSLEPFGVEVVEEFAVRFVVAHQEGAAQAAGVEVGTVVAGWTALDGSAVRGVVAAAA